MVRKHGVFESNLAIENIYLRNARARAFSGPPPQTLQNPMKKRTSLQHTRFYCCGKGGGGGRGGVRDPPHAATKRYVHNGLGTNGSPNVTYTVIWPPMTHQTLRAQWFGHTWLTKRYVHNGLGTRGSPNVAYTTVRAAMAHQTLPTQWFGHP